MQIICLALSCLFVTLISTQCISLTISNLVSHTMLAQRKNTTVFKISHTSSKQPEFVLLTKNCFMDKTCLAYVYVKSKPLSKEKLIELSNMLNKKNKEKERLTVFFFDNLELGRAHAKGKLELRDLENNAKGLFRYDAKEEYVKIRLAGKISNNWDRWKTIYTKKFQTK